MNDHSQTRWLTVRADGHSEIGYGHLLRTRCVAAAICKIGPYRVRYLMRQESDPRPVRASADEIIRLDKGGAADIAKRIDPGEGPLLIDTYRFTEADFQRLHEAGYLVVAFDDSCRLGFYWADGVIDYAPGAEELPYEGPPATRFCLGPEWFPLRPEFKDAAAVRATRGSNPANRVRSACELLVTFGGSDPDDQTSRVVRLLTGSQATGNVTVLLGPGYRGEAAEIASDDPRFTVVCNAENVAALFARADLAVCGAGGTCLELASLGVPMVLLELSDDQRRIAQHVARAGAAVNLGDWRTTGDRQILEGLRQLTHSPAGKQRMATAGRGLVDGKGAVRTGRMIDELWRSLPAASLAGNALR